MLDDAKPSWTATQKHHEQMHNLYCAQMFDEAIQQCNLIKRGFDGQMEKYYDMWIERCEFQKTQDLPPDWNGTFIAQSK